MSHRKIRNVEPIKGENSKELKGLVIDLETDGEIDSIVINAHGGAPFPFLFEDVTDNTNE